MTARLNLQTGQYHQVLALTQYMINLGLENLFKEKGFEDPTRKPMNVKVQGNGFQNLVLGPPKIIIETLDDNHTNIFYRIHLRSGLFKTAVDSLDGENPQSAELASVSYVVNDWYFTFMVDLAAKINSPKAAETSFGVWTENDVNLDSKNQKINIDKIQPGQRRIWEAEPEPVKKGFDYIITLVIERLIKADMQNLGITASAIDAGKISVADPGHPPTFMPVDCRFQTYPWMDPNQASYEEYNGIDGNGRLNYLLYLEMTGNDDGSVPEMKPEGRFLREVGNWTDGRRPGEDPRSQFGTFMLTHQKFLDEYLLPKFDKMNRMVKIDLSNLKATVRTDGNHAYFDRDIDVVIGAGVTSGLDKDDAQYRFTKGTNFSQAMTGILSGQSFPTVLPPNALTWYWSFNDEPMDQHREDRYFGILYKAEHWGKASSTTCTRLSIVPGSNQIKFEGCSKSRISWTKDWDIVPNKTEDGENFSGLSKYQTYMQASYTRAGENFKIIVESLKNALQGQERFFLPAAGIFFFKNPIFSQDGSLLCELEYNGNAQIETPNADAPLKRTDTIDAKIKSMLPGVSDAVETAEERKDKDAKDKDAKEAK